MSWLLEVFAAFVGTTAFAILFRAPKAQCWVCGFVGGVAWLTYRTASLWLAAATSSFLAALLIALLSRVLAVYRKVPANVIMIPGVFPIISGIGIYNMIYNLFVGNTLQGLSGGFEVLKIIGAIVLGLVAAFSLPRSWFRRLSRP